MPTQQIAIDIGSANTLIYLKGRGLVLCAPTYIATDRKTGKEMGFGLVAKKMLGKAPPNIKVSRPIRDGVIDDIEDTTLLLARYLEKAELVSFIARPDAYVGVSEKYTGVEIRALQEAVYEAGTRNVTTVKKTLAAAVGAGMKVLSHRGSMIVDIGEGTTECAVISRGDVVVSRCDKIAGSDMDKAIINYFRNDRKIEIGEQSAERLKIKLGSAIELIDRGTAPIVGRDLKTGMATSTIATSKEIRSAIAPVLKAVVQQIRLTLEATPPELASDVCNNGIVLAGGGAMLPGIAEYISSILRIKVAVAPKPLECVCVGMGKMLESDGELNRLLYRQ